MMPTISNECSLFLLESEGKPLIKSLPKNSDGFRRVKVRKKKNIKEFEKQFNESFFMEFDDIRNRAVFVNGHQPNSNDVEPFYIFPTNGYRFMYSPQVFNSTELYKDTFDKLIEASGDDGIDIFRELLQLSYSYDNLPNAIDSGCEIILYDISYYYAIRASLVDSYKNWFYNSKIISQI